MEDFEVCTFCGEMFTGEKMSKYHVHYENCRTEYKDETKIENSDWESYYY